MAIELILTQEKEVFEDCSYCGKPFWTDYRNQKYVVEMDGSDWLHISCAKEFGERLLQIAKGE